MINRPKTKLRKEHNIFILLKPILFGLLFFSYPVYSQPLNSESELAAAIENAINTLPASQLGIYNGRDYTPPNITAAGHPYFPTSEFEPGMIAYDGIHYKDIFLIFDASLQCVVIEDYSGNKICPVEENIESFTVGGHTFKRLSNISGLTPGFYDVLVEGHLYAKRSKSGGGMQWKSSTAYFFLNGNKVVQLTNKNSVIESMADKENDIRQFMRMKNLSFGKNKERSLVEVVRHYLSLREQ